MLAPFQGAVCAIGGNPSAFVEYLNSYTNIWTYLPSMQTARQNAAAVELNSEL